MDSHRDRQDVAEEELEHQEQQQKVDQDGEAQREEPSVMESHRGGQLPHDEQHQVAEEKLHDSHADEVMKVDEQRFQEEDELPPEEAPQVPQAHQELEVGPEPMTADLVAAQNPEVAEAQTAEALPKSVQIQSE